MTGILSLVLWAIVVALVVLTSGVKRPRVLWMLVFLPPLCLIGLWWIPFSRNTEYSVWFPAIIALLVSLISIPVRLCDIAHKWRRSASDVNRVRLIRLMRPILVVLIMGGLLARERMACSAFGVYATELAQRLQQTCKLQGTCPRTIEGWAVVEENPTFYASEHAIARLGRRALVRYENMVPANQFRLTVNYGNRIWFDVYGGAEGDLKVSDRQ